MSKKLYVRFFVLSSNQVPYDCHLVYDDTGSRTATQRIADYAHNVADWMLKFPDGKVDFIWL